MPVSEVGRTAARWYKAIGTWIIAARRRGQADPSCTPRLVQEQGYLQVRSRCTYHVGVTMNRDRILHLRIAVANLNNSFCILHHQHDVWLAYAKRMRALPEGYDFEGEGIFHEWLIRNYADSIAIGIRRVVFPGSGSTTCLIGLLTGLNNDRDRVTFEEAMAVYGPEDAYSLRRHEEWLRARFFRDSEQPTMSKAAIGKDIDRLANDHSLASIKAWADKRVAHSVPTAEVHAVAFDDIESALKVGGDVLYDYSVLLAGSGMTRYTPVIADRWEGVLDRLMAGPSKRE